MPNISITPEWSAGRPASELHGIEAELFQTQDWPLGFPRGATRGFLVLPTEDCSRVPNPFLVDFEYHE